MVDSSIRLARSKLIIQINKLKTILTLISIKIHYRGKVVITEHRYIGNVKFYTCNDMHPVHARHTVYVHDDILEKRKLLTISIHTTNSNTKF